MNFTRRKRIALELLGPPPLGVICYSAVWLVMIIRYSHRTGHWPPFDLAAIAIWAVVMVLYAYLFTGMQSLIYMLIMEWRFARGLDPRGWPSVGLSSMLGLISGAAVIPFFGFRPADLGFIFTTIGLAVGFTLGWLIRRWSAPAARCPDGAQ
ncbi:MAG TPA: hypothetical protein VL200_13555 [Lacunisphaera sp.]|jgi:cyanate permease|nr:hypothetical protein [Lacunisphaera sp.]